MVSHPYKYLGDGQTAHETRDYKAGGGAGPRVAGRDGAGDVGGWGWARGHAAVISGSVVACCGRRESDGELCGVVPNCTARPTLSAQTWRAGGWGQYVVQYLSRGTVVIRCLCSHRNGGRGDIDGCTSAGVCCRQRQRQFGKVQSMWMSMNESMTAKMRGKWK